MTDSGYDERWVHEALRSVTRDRLVETVCGVIDVPSPTGGERRLAEWIVGDLDRPGLTSRLQIIDEAQANAVAELSSRGRRLESLLLYAPMDTFTTGDPDLDLPWANDTMRDDMLPRSQVVGDAVMGLGAGNPKGHVAAIMVAMAALAEAAVPLDIDVVAGFGAGGMPSFAVPGIGVAGRENTGHGVGASFLLERGYTTDHAVIAKPGWAVSHEEVGLVWLDIDVCGTHTYVGSRHRLPYSNPAVTAAHVVTRLESWLEDYAIVHESGTMRPQGIVSSIRGGFDRLAASTSASVRLRLDLRVTPEQTAPQVVREVRGALDALSTDLDAPISVKQIAYVPATRTDPDATIIRATRAAWESVDGQQHSPISQHSGATDANILRLRGVPTARVGMPKMHTAPDGGEVDFTLGMNLVDVREVRRLVEVLLRTVLAIDGAARERKAD